MRDSGKGQAAMPAQNRPPFPRTTGEIMLQYALTSIPVHETSQSARSYIEGATAKSTKTLPAHDERLDVLNALLSNPEFRASERNKRFLKLVVEEAVAGRSGRIKAFHHRCRCARAQC